MRLLPFLSALRSNGHARRLQSLEQRVQGRRARYVLSPSRHNQQAVSTYNQFASRACCPRWAAFIAAPRVGIGPAAPPDPERQRPAVRLFDSGSPCVQQQDGVRGEGKSRARRRPVRAASAGSASPRLATGQCAGLGRLDCADVTETGLSSQETPPQDVDHGKRNMAVSFRGRGLGGSTGANL